MVKPELGVKRVCVNCSAKFYDLLRTPPVCPKCSTEQPPEQPRLRRGAASIPAEDKRPKKIPLPGVETEPDLDVADDEVEEDVLEDTADLDDEDALDDDADDLDVSEPPEEH